MNKILSCNKNDRSFKKNVLNYKLMNSFIPEPCNDRFEVFPDFHDQQKIL